MFEGKSIVSFRRNYVRAILVCFCISWKCLLFKLCTGLFKAGFYMNDHPETIVTENFDRTFRLGNDRTVKTTN